MIEHPAHEVHGAEGMLKARVEGAGIYKIRQPELLDMAEPLKPRMGDNVEDQLALDLDKSINGVVNDSLFVQCCALISIVVCKNTRC